MKEKNKEDVVQKEVRRHLECKMIEEWLASLGLEFCAMPSWGDNGDPVTADEFIGEALCIGRDPFSPEGFQKTFKSITNLGGIRPVVSIASEVEADLFSVHDHF